MKVVIDTNVLVAGLLNPYRTPAKIINLLINGKIHPLYDTRIIHEYSLVLRREKFGFKPEWIEALLEYVKSEGEFIVPESTTRSFHDEEDKKFYEVAVSGEAEYLVTGNKKHFPREDLIKSPKEFLELVVSGKN